MKKTLLVAAVVAAFAPSLVMAEAGDIVVRLRATHINPDVSSVFGRKTEAVGKEIGLGPGVAGLLFGAKGVANEVEVDSNTIPELDFSYYITKNIAAELILALGSKHDAKSAGVGAGMTKSNLGEVNLLPPTLTLQWHFMPDETFDPYVGAGVTYVRAMDRSLALPMTAGLGGPGRIHIEQSMWGAAIQAGFDVNLKDRWLVNFDVKKIWLDTDVTLNTSKIPGTTSPGFHKVDSLDLDPWVISVGFGKKF